MEGYKFEILTDSSFEILVPLYKKAFGKEISSFELAKKYDTSKICSIKNIGYLAFNKKGEAIGFYGLLPCYSSNGKERVLVAQSADTLVDPNLERNKVFLELAQRTHEFCKENGIKAIYGFPNMFSFPMFIKKIGWTHIHNIEAYHSKVRCLPFLRVIKFFKLKGDFFEAYQAKIIQSISHKTKKIDSILCGDSEYSIEKSSKFIEYKSNYNSVKYFINLNGIDLWVKLSPMFLQVGDLSYCSESDFKQLNKDLSKLCFRLGIPHFRFHISSQTYLHKLLKQSLSKLDLEYPAGGISFDENFDINELNFIMADNDTF
jgi:hypothetical protein